jgi:hypothetical protein
MPWWEIIVVLVIWRTVRSWRRSRRSGRDVRNSRHSSPSCLLTVPKQSWLADTDPSRIAHDGTCENCGVQAQVPMQRTRLERRPWRIVWWCAVCGRQSRARVAPELVPLLVSWDKAGGMSLSMREVADFVSADADELLRAVEDEL